MKRQVVTNKTDAVIAVVVTDRSGYFKEGPHTESPVVLSYVGWVAIRLAVGREYMDSEYKHLTASGTVTKDAQIDLGTITLRYVTETIGGQTYYRLPRLTDDVDISALPQGLFRCFKIKVKRETFDSVGPMKVAICDMSVDSYFDDQTQKVWSKYGETNIVYTDI